MNDVRQCVFFAELASGQQLLLAALNDDRLALLKDGVVEQIWDAGEIGASDAVVAFLNICQHVGTVPSTQPGQPTQPPSVEREPVRMS